MGKDPNSAHNFAVQCYNNLTNQSCHIEKIIQTQSAEQIVVNCLYLEALIDVVGQLTFQACALREHDECNDSNNQGNSLRMLKFSGSHSENVAIVFENAPKNAKHTHKNS